MAWRPTSRHDLSFQSIFGLPKRMRTLALGLILCLLLSLSWQSVAFAPTSLKAAETLPRLANPNTQPHPRSYYRETPSKLPPRNVAMGALPAETLSLMDKAADLPSLLPPQTTSFLGQLSLSMDKDTAEALAGPFFGASLFPYLVFLYFLSRKENECPKGVTVGFVTLLFFVFLTIPGAIAAKVLYGASLADCDWIHGSAESLLTITNLVTVIAFRQALSAKEKGTAMPPSATSYAPMSYLAAGLIALAGVTAAVPALMNPEVHTPYLGGFMDLPFSLEGLGAFPEPDNALTVACWIIHVSSLVEFLVAMGFAWRWADVTGNPTWKGLTWGLLPLHSSGITACTYHLFFNRIPVLVPIQAALTCFGNTTAAYAAYRIARSNGWRSNLPFVSDWLNASPDKSLAPIPGATFLLPDATNQSETPKESQSLVGFEDLGDALAGDNDYTFLIKLFAGCAIASYAIKYGATFFSFPYEANVYLGLSVIIVPSLLNAFKWYKRSQDPTFEGWF